jgi:DNA-binding transcriptional MerR regulator
VPDGEELRLSVAAVARRLGVAPATLRTWDRRYGLGPAEHAPGSHRRYGATDVARLEAMQHALLRGVGPAEAARYALSTEHPREQAAGGQPDPTAAAPELPEPPDQRLRLPPSQPRAEASAQRGSEAPRSPDALRVRPIRLGGRPLRMPGSGARARGLARAAVALDAAAIREVLDDSLVEEGVVATWDLVVRPVLGAIANCWEDTGVGVGVEHLLSEGTLDAFRDATKRAPAPENRRPVLLACVPDELHSLPLHALSAELAGRGIGCRVLGAALPADALSDAIRRTAPSVVFLWAQASQYAATDLLAGLPRIRQRVRVFVGGPGWTPRRLPRSAELLDDLASAGDRIAAAMGAEPRDRTMTTLSS